MAKTRAVIFDLDGTLFDHAAGVRAGLEAVTRKFEIVEDPEDVRVRNAQLKSELETRMLAGDLTPDEARVQRFTRLLDELGVPDASEHGKQAMKTYGKAYESAAALLPGATDILDRVRDRGLKVGVLSNFVRAVEGPRLAKFDLDAHVDALLFQDDVPAPKPDPTAFHTMCAVLDVEPKAALMVGDTIRVDVSGALDAGLKAVWFSPSRRDLVLAREIKTINRLDQVLENL